MNLNTLDGKMLLQPVATIQTASRRIAWRSLSASRSSFSDQVVPMAKSDGHDGVKQVVVTMPRRRRSPSHSLRP
jgi:hypothetical protein